MILVKLSAEDLRIIQGAKLQEELLGVRQLVLDRVEQAKLLKEFNKQPTVRSPGFRWKEALEVAREVLGNDVTFPKITDYLWYRRINGAIMHDGLDEAYIHALSEYARDNLKMPVKFDFLVCQHRRILEGEFNVKTSAQKAVVAESTMRAQAGPELPEE